MDPDSNYFEYLRAQPDFYKKIFFYEELWPFFSPNYVFPFFLCIRHTVTEDSDRRLKWYKRMPGVGLMLAAIRVRKIAEILDSARF